MDMSKAIREGRDRLGMSQEALAERLGVSRQAVSKWEMGTSVPSPENRRALSEILGTDLQVERETAPPVPLRRWKRLTLAAGETPALSLKLKPGEDVLEAARDLVEDLKLAAEESAAAASAGSTP